MIRKCNDGSKRRIDERIATGILSSSRTRSLNGGFGMPHDFRYAGHKSSCVRWWKQSNDTRRTADPPLSVGVRREEFRIPISTCGRFKLFHWNKSAIMPFYRIFIAPLYPVSKRNIQIIDRYINMFPSLSLSNSPNSDNQIESLRSNSLSMASRRPREHHQMPYYEQFFAETAAFAAQLKPSMMFVNAQFLLPSMFTLLRIKEEIA